jgi:hypothetical protein
MPIIKCRLQEDGRLTPSSVEFEPGDVIRFESHKPVYARTGGPVAMQVLSPFTLDQVSTETEGGIIRILTHEEEAYGLAQPPLPHPHPAQPIGTKPGGSGEPGWVAASNLVTIILT